MPCFPPPMEKQVSVDSRLRFIAKTPREEPLLPSHVRLSRRFAPHTFFAAGRRGSCCPRGSSPSVLTPAQRARRRAPQPARRGRDGDPRLQRWGAGGGRLEQNPFVPSQGTAAHGGLAGGGAVPAQLGGPGGALAWGPACIPPPGSAGMWAVPREKRRWGPVAEPPESPSARLGGAPLAGSTASAWGRPRRAPGGHPLSRLLGGPRRLTGVS